MIDRGMKSRSLCEEMRLEDHCIRSSIVIKSIHIAWKLNVLVDQLSRLKQVIQMEWILNQEVYNAVFDHLGSSNIGLFTTRENKCLLVFFSPFLDPEVLGVEDLAESWVEIYAYA